MAALCLFGLGLDVAKWIPLSTAPALNSVTFTHFVNLEEVIKGRESPLISDTIVAT